MIIWNGLMWIIVLIIAYFTYPKGMKYLNGLKLHENNGISGLLTGRNTQNNARASPLKSENYVPSAVEDQNILSVIEESLTKQPTRANFRTTFPSNRWINASYPPGSSLPDSVFREISRMIFCANLNTPVELCRDIKLLSKDSNILGLKSKERVIIGFKMFLETSPCSAARFRIKLHEHFNKKLWPVIRRNIDFSNEDREIIYVGYDSGGALASLAAWNSIQHFEAFNPSEAIIKNGNNQVKVFTWDELPLFTRKTAAKSPLLPCNHSRFSTLDIPDSHYRSASRSSGGIDEFSYFGTSGDEISFKSADYIDFSERFKAKNVNSFDDEAIKTLASKLLSTYIKEKHFRELDLERASKLITIMSHHIQHLSIMYELVLNKYRIYLTDIVLEEPKACASALAKKLSTEIFPGSTVTCRVVGFEHELKIFQIRCAYKPSNLKIFAHLMTFDAILGDKTAHEMGREILAFMEEVNLDSEGVPEPGETQKEKEKKTTKMKKSSKKLKKTDDETDPNDNRALRYIGPEPINDNWSSCLFELFLQNPKLSLISPFDIKNKNIYPRCTYLPFDSDFNRKASSNNYGCYLRAPNVAQELLQVFKTDPQFFYRSVSPKTMRFPQRCHKLLFHIPFNVNDRVSLQENQQLAVDYLTQLVSMNPMADPEVTLWNPRDTDDFKTIAYIGSKIISPKDLADRSNYEENFENGIIKCLSSPSYPYRDCTNPINRWVPKACPSACSLVSDPNDFFCKQIKSCPSAGYYISVFQEGTAGKLERITKILTRGPHPQFGIFHVKKRNHYFPFNLALFRMPLND